MKRGSRVIIALLSVALATLLVCELVLWLFMADVAPFLEVIEQRPGQECCYRLKPGAQGSYEGSLMAVDETTVNINSRGWRDRELAPRVPNGPLRIAVQGDSVVFGLGCDLEDTLPKQLETMLLKRLGRPVEVINAGVPGYNLPQEVALFPTLVEDYRPDVVVFLVSPVDLVDQPCTRWRDYHRALATSCSLARLAAVFCHRIAVGSEGAPPADRMRAVLEREFEQLAASVEEARPDFPRIVIAGDSIGDFGRADWWPSILKRYDFHSFEMGDAVREVYEHPDRYVIKWEGHPNRAGYELMAGALADYLVSSALFDQL